MSNLENKSNVNLIEHSESNKTLIDTDTYLNDLDEETLALLTSDSLWPEAIEEINSNNAENNTSESIDVNLPDDIPAQSDARPLATNANVETTSNEPKSNELELNEIESNELDANKPKSNALVVKISKKKPVPPSRISLRQRNAIQLHPFTLEYEQYRELISKTVKKYKRAFTAKNLSEVDTELHDLLTAGQEQQQETFESQYIPITQQSESSVGLLDQNYALTQDETMLDSEHFEKYHLDKLILPSLNTQEKRKPITFTKKKKYSARTPSRFSQPLNKDIFAFDYQPKAIFNISSSDKDMDDRHDNANGDYDKIDDDDDEEEHIHFAHRPKRRRIILDSEEEDDNDEGNEDNEDEGENEEEEEEEEEKEKDIFAMPKRLKPHPRQLERKVTNDNEAIPVVQDEYEFRQPKRKRFAIRDVLKKKHALNGLLPASFLKTFEKDIQEEDRLRAGAKHRSKPTNSAKPKPVESKSKSTQDIFAAFLESESEGHDSEDDTPTEYSIPNVFSDNEEFDGIEQVDKSNTEQEKDSSDDNVSTKLPKASRSPSFQSKPRFQTYLEDHYTISENKMPILLSKKPIEESVEDNRVHSGSRRTTSKKPKRKVPKSSLAIKKPLNEEVDTTHLIRLQVNPAPHRRRKRPKRTRDDIYVHAPLFSRLWFDRSGQAPDNNGSVFLKSDKPKRRAFDDIYVGTKQSSLYACEPLDSSIPLKEPVDEKSNLFDMQFNLHVIHSLESVTKRTRHLFDHDLRRIKGLTNTVYLHHQLLTPLLSATPDLASAYEHLKESFSNPILFDVNVLWQDIDSDVIDFLFFKASRDITTGCIQDDKHDTFYVFVSICLTQWVPQLDYTERLKSTEIFMTQTRSLMWTLSSLIHGQPKSTIPWQTIIKAGLFCLDWTCRLHHLGVQQQEWSVVHCTQLLIDALVYAGHDNQYAIEAWVCLIQIMSVSSRGVGYCFYEKIFLDQLRSSIKRLENAPGEYEHRKTSRKWAETLNYILDKYMMM